MSKIYCCECEHEVEARKVTGRTLYPHRLDLAHKTFQQCETCKNYVGVHKGGKPLGVIPTPELRRARQEIHGVLDPLWKRGRITRNALYAWMREELGHEYHTAEIRTVEEARTIYSLAQGIANDLNNRNTRKTR